MFREMARVAASLHASRFAPAGRVLTLLPERRSSPLAQTYSDLGRRHATLLKRLEARRELVAHVDPTSLHGDFHPEQFLIDVEQIGLTDFDSACWGDAAHDLGRFASHVYSIGATLTPWRRFYLDGTFSYTDGGAAQARFYRVSVDP